MDIRNVARVVEPRMVIEGAGVLLRRSIAPSRENPLDPFLLFDHFAFNNPIEGPLVGFPMHPHRGIETVTYMLEGSVHHRDSLGNSGRIGPGDVQWMTSGRGIMHEEMPRRSADGNVFGFQLWVNLPASLKMGAPRYQEVLAADIPAIARDGATIRVVAGEVDGQSGPVRDIAARPTYIDVTLAPEAAFVHPIPRGQTAIAYVFEGEGTFGDGALEGGRLAAVQMAVLGDGEAVEARAAAGRGLRFVLIAGEPFGEPIVPYGPFVMNTEEEIRQALADLRAGTFVKA